MNDWKTIITLLACCVYLTAAPTASADFVGVTTVNPDDPDTEFQCTQGNGAFVPGPLFVCDVFAMFDDPGDRLLSVGNADLQVFNGTTPDVFFQHPFNFPVFSPACGLVALFPDLVCDSFITIGVDCAPPPPDIDGTSADADWEKIEFKFNGRAVGGWFDAWVANNPCPGCRADVNGDGVVSQVDIALLLAAWGPCPGCRADLDGDGDVDPIDLAVVLDYSEFNTGHGLAGNAVNLQVLFLRSSVAQGLSMSGHIDLFWKDGDTGELSVEADVPIECAASCGSCPTDADGSGDTGAFDLALLLGNWGPVTSAAACLNADGDGIIGPADLAILLDAWGACPE